MQDLLQVFKVSGATEEQELQDNELSLGDTMHDYPDVFGQLGVRQPKGKTRIHH